MTRFDDSRARQTAERIRKGIKPEPLVKMAPHDPGAVRISTWDKAA